MIFRPSALLKVIVVAHSIASTDAYWSDFFRNLFASCPDVDRCDGCHRYNMKKCTDDGGGVLDEQCSFEVATLEDDGYFCASLMTCGQDCGKEWLPFFSDGSLKDASIATGDTSMTELVSGLGGNLDGPYEEHQGLLSADDCRVLREFLDETYFDTVRSGAKVQNNNWKHDFRLQVKTDKLQELISPSGLERLVKTFREHDDRYYLTRISLRRAVDNGTRIVPYHNDGDRVAFIVMLNSDELDGGGNIQYVTSDGIHKTSLGNGDGAIHSDSVIHSVTGFEGTRYILFLMGEKKKEAELFKDLFTMQGSGYDMHQEL